MSVLKRDGSSADGMLRERGKMLGFTVSRADPADFMIKAVEKGSTIGEIVGVCN